MSRSAPKTFWDTLPPDHKPGQPLRPEPMEPFDFAAHSLAEIDEWFRKKMDPHGVIRKREQLAARLNDPNYKPLTGAMYPRGSKTTWRKKAKPSVHKAAATKKGKKKAFIDAVDGYQPAGYPKGIKDDGKFECCLAAQGGCNLKPCLVVLETVPRGRTKDESYMPSFQVLRGWLQLASNLQLIEG